MPRRNLAVNPSPAEPAEGSLALDSKNHGKAKGN